MFEITDGIIQSHIDKIRYVIESIPENQLTVLVGPNGVGKSLIRNLLYTRFYKLYGKTNVVRSMSMELRTGPRPDLGALSSVFNDNEFHPTSRCTYDLIESMIPEGSRDIEHFYIFDEPDIGMSRESEIGIARYIFQRWSDLKDRGCKGGLVITHSDFIVKELVSNKCPFIYLGYNSVSEDYNDWAHRKIEPTDFRWLKRWSSMLFEAVKDRSVNIKER